MFKWLFGFEDDIPKVELDAVVDLIKRIKAFNAGAVDVPLTNHIDKVYKAWLLENMEIN